MCGEEQPWSVSGAPEVVRNGRITTFWKTLIARLLLMRIWKASTWILPVLNANGGRKTAYKAIGCTKGGLNTKIHTVVDGLGNPLICSTFCWKRK
jgi:hypothetical protein